jgi:uncharacterized protein (TIGR02271 family)
LAQEERRDRSTEGEYSLSGYQIYDRHYEKIGKVDDLFVDEGDRPEYVGVKMGFLGTRSTLIPVEIVRVNDKRRLVEVEADKETVKEGPTFGHDREITPEFEQRVLSYYGIEAAWTSTERGTYGAYYSDDMDHERTVLQPSEQKETSEHSDERRSDGAMYDAESERGSDLEDEDELRVQRSEEELRAGTREREAGGVNVRKRVKTDREQVRVPKRRGEVHAERVPAEGETSEAEIGDDEIRVPIIEEEIVVEKRPVVKEEIRLRKEVIEDEEVVEEDVRKEEVDVDDQTERGVTRERAEDVDETGHSLPEKTRDKTSSEDRSGADTKKESKEDTRTNPPFEGYDELTVKEAKKKFGGLSEGELEKIRSYEKEHKNRKTLIKQLDRKLGDAS